MDLDSSASYAVIAKPHGLKEGTSGKIFVHCILTVVRLCGVIEAAVENTFDISCCFFGSAVDLE